MVCNVKYTSDALSVCLSICTKESIKRDDDDDDDDDDDGLMFQRVLHRSTHQILVYHRIRFQRVHFCV